MPVALMHCLHAFSVAGSLLLLSCGNGAGSCSGVCLETAAKLRNMVKQNSSFPASGSNPKVLAVCDQNMLKFLFVRLNRTFPFKCEYRMLAVCISMQKTWIIYIYVCGVDPLSVLCSYGEKFVADWSDQLD